MIGRLTGTVVEHMLEGSCIVDVGGVGYEVFVPMGALGRLPQAPEQVVLHKSAMVEGDIETPSIVVEKGAVFNGALNTRKSDSNLKAVTGGQSSGNTQPGDNKSNQNNK